MTNQQKLHLLGQHDCATEHRYQVDWNKAVVPVGTLWVCPTCQASWMRTTETFDGISYLYGVQPALWKRLNWLQRLVFQSVLNNTPIIRPGR